MPSPAFTTLDRTCLESMLAAPDSLCRMTMMSLASASIGPSP